VNKYRILRGDPQVTGHNASALMSFTGHEPVF
jgi:hypothetical protein